MPAESITNQLRDIQLPAPISWWPLASGWYLCALVIVLACAALGYWMWRRHRHYAARREALAVLQQCQNAYQQGERSASWAMRQISMLLRRLLLVTHPRGQVANVVGDDWVKLISADAPALQDDEIQQLLRHGAYQATLTRLPETLFPALTQWVKQHV